jgi:hypothetical protein
MTVGNNLLMCLFAEDAGEDGVDVGELAGAVEVISQGLKPGFVVG